MKKAIILIIAAISLTGIAACKKDKSPVTSQSSHVIKFKLYTDKDLSDDTNNITFSIFVRTGNKTLFDSILTTIQVKDIPTAANALIYEKKIYANTILIAGFHYVIENVGNSSYTDTISANEPSKLIDYAFH